MMIIIGFDAMMWELGRWIYGGPNWLSTCFTHPKWFGLTLYDCVAPAFIFIAGLSFPFSYASQVAKGVGSRTIHLRIIKRALLLIVLGWVTNGLFTTGFANLRYGSILGKIGLSWMIAALVFVHFRRTARVCICAALVIGYALLLSFVVAPDFPGASSFSIEGNFIGWLDRLTMPGVLSSGDVINGVEHKNLCEASGLYTSFFASATAMIGMFAGEIVRSVRLSGNRKTLGLLVLAAGLAVAGFAMLPFIPLCKQLYTPSYLLLTGAGSTGLFAGIYWLTDVRKSRWWTPFFVAIGMNAIAIYLLRFIVDFGAISRFFLGAMASHLSPSGEACVVNAGSFAVSWLVTWFLFRHKIFFKV